MASILYVNSCPRGGLSRTRRLGDAFLQGMEGETVLVHDLPALRLPPFEEKSLARREALCDARAVEDPMFDRAREFQSADCVVIAAPYWDLSFPSMLKVWVEHMFVRNLTFVYRDNQPIGLCRAQQMVYLTTSGSPIGANDWGYLYMQAVAHMLGIRDCFRISAEGLDIDGADTEGLVQKACVEARALAAALRDARKEQDVH